MVEVRHCSTSGGADRPTTLRRGHDAIQSGGRKIPQHEFLQAHADLLRQDEWIIDGFGSAALSWDDLPPPIRWFTSICHF